MTLLKVFSFWRKSSRPQNDNKFQVWGENAADVRLGISYALSQLNYEFSKNKATMKPFSPEEASMMEVAGLKVGERVPIEL